MKLFTLIALALSTLFTPVVEHTADESPAFGIGYTEEAAPSEVRFDRVEARSTDVWNLWLPAGEVTHITVRGDGDTDLDFFVYDENDNLIDSDVDGTDIYFGHISPSWTGSFRLEIRNLGGVYNAYRLEVD